MDVLVCDDHYLVREGIRAALERLADVRVVGLASDPVSLWARLAEASTVDAVVLDIAMPPTNTNEGIVLAKEIRRERPDVGVVVLSQHNDAEYALELLSEGSAGLAYLLKEHVGDDVRLHQALAAVTSGSSLLDTRVVDALLAVRRRPASSAAAAIDRLSEREYEVLEHIAAGLDNAAIAARLYISERAVEKHANAVFRKLGLTDIPSINRRVTAVLYFLQRGAEATALTRSD
jgi:DNA-binding NarL/FixJ family response regulator